MLNLRFRTRKVWVQEIVLDDLSRLWHWLTTICLSAWLSDNHSLDSHPITPKLGSYAIPPSHAYYLIKFWLNSTGTFFCWILVKNFRHAFQGRNYWSYLRNSMSDSHEKKSTLIEYWLRYWAGYVTLPFDYTHDLGLGLARSKFEIALSQEWDGCLTWNERDLSRTFMTITVT